MENNKMKNNDYKALKGNYKESYDEDGKKKKKDPWKKTKEGFSKLKEKWDKKRSKKTY